MSVFKSRIIICETVIVRKYVSAIKKKLVGKYIQDDSIFQNVKFTETLEGIYKRYGLPGKDTRMPISIKLLIAISKVIKIEKHNERCCFAAAVIAFFCCLRIGEITSKSSSAAIYLKRINLSRFVDHGIIKLEKTKTDRYKRGVEIIYVKMNNEIDPVMWMNKYVDENKVCYTQGCYKVATGHSTLPNFLTIFFCIRPNLGRLQFASRPKLGRVQIVDPVG